VTGTQTIPAALWAEAKEMKLIADDIPVPE